MILTIDKLCVAYGVVQVLRNLSLEVGEAEVVALIGANGAGKTTTLKSISGLLKCLSGSIRFKDIELRNLRPHRIVGLGISHVPERRGIFANLTVYENLLMGAFQRRIHNSDLEEVFALFPVLKERKDQIGGTLSGGEQQMLAISRALLSRPQLMLLDEPSLGLAPQITQVIFKTIQKIRSSGTSVLLVEQNAFAALRISDRGYVLECGQIAFSDTSDRLLQNDQVRKVYLGEV